MSCASSAASSPSPPSTAASSTSKPGTPPSTSTAWRSTSAPTSIVGTLLHLETGEELAAVGSVNPQTVYGGDLMSRIAYAQFDEKKLVTLRAKVPERGQRLRQGRVPGGRSLARAPLQDRGGRQHLHAPHLPRRRRDVRGARALRARGEATASRSPRASFRSRPRRTPRVCLLPIVAGFVGADTMACVLATRIYESEELRALVDIGTNGEVGHGLEGTGSWRARHRPVRRSRARRFATA